MPGQNSRESGENNLRQHKKTHQPQATEDLLGCRIQSGSAIQQSSGNAEQAWCPAKGAEQLEALPTEDQQPLTTGTRPAESHRA